MVIAKLPGEVPVRAEERVEFGGADEAAEMASENSDAPVADIRNYFLEHGRVGRLGDAGICDDDSGRRGCRKVVEGSFGL